MPQSIRDVMKTELVALDGHTNAADAARQMRDNDIGDVLVMDDGRLKGIVTDRDLVVRCMADRRDPERTEIGSLCSADLATLSPDASVEEAVRLMEERAVRRLPVVEDERPVGIVSIGDLAIARDRESALGEISAAPPNN